MQEADAEVSVVGVVLKGGDGGLEVEERLAKGRVVMLAFNSQCGIIGRDRMTSQGNSLIVIICILRNGQCSYELWNSLSEYSSYAKCSN